KRQLNKLSRQRLSPARKLRPSQQNLQQKHQNLPQSLVQSLVQSQPKSLLLKNQNQQLRSQHRSQVQSLARNQLRPVLAIIRSRPKRTQPRHDLAPAVEHRAQVTTPSPPSRACAKNVPEAHSLPDVVAQDQGVAKVVQHQDRNLVVQNHSSLATPAHAQHRR